MTSPSGSATAEAPPTLDRRARILACAARLVAARGYRNVSMDLVAQAAGVGKQTLYRRWPNKAVMFVDVYRWLAPSDAIVASGGGLQRDLAAMLTGLFDAYRSSPAGAVLAGLLGDAADDARVREAIREGLVVARADLLDAPLAAAELGSGDVVFAQEVIVAVISRRLLTAPETLDAAFARELARRIAGLVGAP